MKRDMDLVRQLLLYSEENSLGAQGSFLEFSKFEHSNDESILRAHIQLMEEASLLDEALPSWEDDVGIGRLTWTGHDFLDAIRNPEIWNQTKDIAKTAGGWTFGILGDLAKGLIKTQIEKHTGVEL